MYSWLTGEHIQNTITSYLHKFLTQQPIFLQLLQILGWAVNHPIISLVILLVLTAILWIIIKGIVRLIETASWSIIKFPLKLIQSLIKVSHLTLKNIISNNNNSELIAVNSLKIHQHKQQRLTEIYRRLETIQQEQQQLLQ
jgi:replication fork clamp-binding protein CrfC